MLVLRQRSILSELESLTENEQVTRKSTEAERLAIFQRQFFSVLASEPYVLGYMGYMYAQAAIELHPYISAQCEDLAHFLIKSLEDNSAESQKDSALSNLVSTYGDYEELTTLANACFGSTDRWLQSYRSRLKVNAASMGDTQKTAIYKILYTTPEFVSSSYIKYPSQVELKVNGTVGTVTIEQNIVDPSLVLAVGDYIGDSKVTKLANDKFIVDTAASFSTNTVVPGFSKELPVFMDLTFPSNPKGLFNSIMRAVADRTDRYIKHGLLLYGTSVVQPYSSSLRYAFPKSTIDAYATLTKLETMCNVPNGIELTILNGLSSSTVNMLTVTKLEETAAAAMQLLDTRSYQ